MNFPWWTATGGTAPTPNDDRRNREGVQEFDFDNLQTAQDNAYDDNDNADFSLTGATAEGQQRQGTTQPNTARATWLPQGLPPTQQMTNTGTGAPGNAAGGGIQSPSGGEKMTHSGILTSIRKASMGQAPTPAIKLTWQANIDGDAAKINDFKEAVAGQHKLMAFIFMRSEATTITLVHGVSKYCSFATAIQMSAHGKFIGFIGDRTERSDPIPVLFQQNKAWDWKQSKISMDIKQMTEHYSEHPGEWGQLWTPRALSKTETVKVQRLLHIPLALVEKLKEKGGQSTPGDVLTLVLKHFGTDNQWTLVKQWCMMAAHADTHGKSLVAFDVSAITDGDTEEFTTWVDQRITATLGERYQGGANNGAYNGGLSQRLGEEQLLTAVGKGVAASMMPWVTSAKQAQVMGATQADAKEGYSKDEVAMLLGFYHESKGTMVQPVIET